MPRHVGEQLAYETRGAPRSAPTVPPRRSRVCLECASPFSKCPVYHAPVRAGGNDTIVTDVGNCWCLQCEHIAHTEALATGTTRAGALRDTHNTAELERLLFETAAVHGEWLASGRIAAATAITEDWARDADWSTARVPVLFLRHYLFHEPTFNDDLLWTHPEKAVCTDERTAADETPPWLRKLRAEVGGMRDVLQAVLAPFCDTMCFVLQNDEYVHDILAAARERAGRVFHIDYPDELLERVGDHLIATAMFLRIFIGYELLALFNGCNWDVRFVDAAVPYLTNTTLQALALNAQLFVDTHLDLHVACETLGAGNYSDEFMASSLAYGGGRAERARYAESNAAPCSLNMTMFERFYPHPVRAPFAGEMSGLGSPLYATNAQADVSLSSAAVASASSSAAAAAAAASSASTSSASSQSMLNAVTRFIFLKPLNYRAMRRSYPNIGTRYMRNYPAIMQWHMNAIECSQYGNFAAGARLRPRWRTRLSVRRTFQFDSLEFETWCANCESGSKNYSKVYIQGNPCPYCKPVEKALWCTRNCMESDFVHAVGLSLGDAEQKDEFRASLLETTVAFARMRSQDQTACKHCEAEQQRREKSAGKLKLLDAAKLMQIHVSAKHECDFCRVREHDDADEVRAATAKRREIQRRIKERVRKKREKKRRLLESATEVESEEEEDDDVGDEDDESDASDSDDDGDAFDEFGMSDGGSGNKKLCSNHVCAPCKLIRDNDRYCFHALKEALAFMIECSGLTEDMHVRDRHWEPYKRILNEGMDEVRSLIDAHFGVLRGGDPREYVAFRSSRDKLWSTIREHVHLSHRCSQPTVSTMRKGSFMKLLREAMATWKAKHYLNRSLTRPQRALDMLESPDVLLECAGAEKVASDPTIRAAHESLVEWRARGYRPEDVRKCAEVAAELAMNDPKSHDRKCPVFFNALRICGMTKFGVELVQSTCYDHEVCRMPDHRLETDCVRRVAENARVDFYILQYFVECYLLREPIRIFPLSLQAARAQM